MNRVVLQQAEKLVVVRELVVSNLELFSLVSKRSETERDQLVLKIIDLGTTALSLLRTSVDVEFVERKFADLSTRVNKLLDNVQEKAVGEITKRFSPTESGSYTKQLGELIQAARKELEGKNSEFTKKAQDLLDPEKKSSAVGQLGALLERAEEDFAEMFDPDRKGSYAARLQHQLDALFGSETRPGAISKIVSESLKPVIEEIRILKDKVGATDAAQKVAEITTLKGFSFEEVVERRLCELARPYGDTVSAVGTTPGAAKSGDFVLDLNGSKHRITVEARNRKVTGPTIKQDLKKAMSARGADFGILVVRSAELLPEYIGHFQIYDHQIVTDIESVEAAYRVARVILESERSSSEGIDAAAVSSKINSIRDAVTKGRAIQSGVTQVENAAATIRNQATQMSTTILALVVEIEGLLRSPGKDSAAA